VPLIVLPFNLPGRIFRSPMPFGPYDLHSEVYDRFWGIYTKRDRVQSIAYSEELISATNSATLQSTDRHHGIVDQKRSHLQRDS